MTQSKLALIVDDNDLNRRLAELLLARLGWGTRSAADGEEALAALDAEDFDLVLLDLRMPGMGGEDVCREIRRLYGPGMPVMAYTGHSIPEEHERILAAGFSGLLVKPASFNDMREVCERLSVSGAQAS